MDIRVSREKYENINMILSNSIRRIEMPNAVIEITIHESNIKYLSRYFQKLSTRSSEK